MSTNYFRPFFQSLYVLLVKIVNIFRKGRMSATGLYFKHTVSMFEIVRFSLCEGVVENTLLSNKKKYIKTWEDKQSYKIINTLFFTCLVGYILLYSIILLFTSTISLYEITSFFIMQISTWLLALVDYYWIFSGEKSQRMWIQTFMYVSQFLLIEMFVPKVSKELVCVSTAFCNFFSVGVVCFMNRKKIKVLSSAIKSGLVDNKDLSKLNILSTVVIGASKSVMHTWLSIIFFLMINLSSYGLFSYNVKLWDRLFMPELILGTCQSLHIVVSIYLSELKNIKEVDDDSMFYKIWVISTAGSLFFLAVLSFLAKKSEYLTLSINNLKNLSFHVFPESFNYFLVTALPYFALGYYFDFKLTFKTVRGKTRHPFLFGITFPFMAMFVVLIVERFSPCLVIFTKPIISCLTYCLTGLITKYLFNRDKG